MCLECYAESCRCRSTRTDASVAGFTGVNCEVQINECDSAPCLNEGRCEDSLDAFHCDCPSGFDGDLCGVDIDECASAPCQNGGTCVDGANGFVCECAEEFMGETCTLVRTSTSLVSLFIFAI